MCVGNPNGTILDLKPKGVTKSTHGGRGGHGRGHGGRGSKPTHEEGSSKATHDGSNSTRGGCKPTLTKLHNDALIEMFNLLKIVVDNNRDLKEEEVDWDLAEEVDWDEEEQEEVLEEGDDEELEEQLEEEEVKVRPLKTVHADSKMGDKRKLFIPYVIRVVLRHADDPQFGGKIDATTAAKLFLIVLFSKLLIPSTSSLASTEVIKAVHNLEHLMTID